MKLLTANLTGKALDWALAKAMNADKVWIDHGYVDVNARFHLHVYEPFNHTDPALCLVLIKSHIYQITHTHGGWEVFSDAGNRQFGDTIEQAVARCVVAMRLGDEVEVPDELCGEQA